MLFFRILMEKVFGWLKVGNEKNLFFFYEIFKQYFIELH
jgi:hypothetical protein